MGLSFSEWEWNEAQGWHDPRLPVVERTVRGPELVLLTSDGNSHLLTLALCQTGTKHLPLNVIL